jgi:hypothetical protein
VENFFLTSGAKVSVLYEPLPVSLLRTHENHFEGDYVQRITVLILHENNIILENSRKLFNPMDTINIASTCVVLFQILDAVCVHRLPSEFLYSREQYVCGESCRGAADVPVSRVRIIL